MTGIDTLRTEERFAFGELNSPPGRLVVRWLSEVSDLQRVVESLVALAQGKQELHYDADRRHWLAGALRSLAEQAGRPGLALQHADATCRRYVDCERAARTRRIGQGNVRFTPHAFPRSEPIERLPRGRPELRTNRHSHFRQGLAKHRPLTLVAAPGDGYAADKWEAL